MMKNFYEKVYDIVAQIPKGTVTTYGCIAMRLGNIRLSRLVGNALHANIDPVNIPCHRVVNREGKLAPMYVFGGIDAQKERLENEGVVVDGDKVDLKKYLWRYMAVKKLPVESVDKMSTAPKITS